jgi:hypothetical protein
MASEWMLVACLAALVIVALLSVRLIQAARRRESRRVSTEDGFLTFGLLLVARIVFGDDRLIGYSLIGFVLSLAIVWPSVQRERCATELAED